MNDLDKKIFYCTLKMSAESSKKASKTNIQIILNFPISFSNVKDKETSENISTKNMNYKIQKTIQQILLNLI